MARSKWANGRRRWLWLLPFMVLCIVAFNYKPKPDGPVLMQDASGAYFLDRGAGNFQQLTIEQAQRVYDQGGRGEP